MNRILNTQFVEALIVTVITGNFIYNLSTNNLPSFAIDELLDEVYDETGITFDESEVRDLNDKSLGSYSSVHLVSLMNHLAGEFFAVIHIYMDDYPKSDHYYSSQLQWLWEIF